MLDSGVHSLFFFVQKKMRKMGKYKNTNFWETKWEKQHTFHLLSRKPEVWYVFLNEL